MVIPAIPSPSEFQRITTKGRTVIDFYADWCGPCKRFAPVFEEIAIAMKPKSVGFYKVNVDENEEVCSKYSIKAMPTFLFMENGVEVGRIMGANEAAFRGKLSELRWV